VLAVADARPEDGCRKCWRDEPDTRTRARRIALLDGSTDLDPEAIVAILEDRHHPTNRSPKAA
jgi:hypothetical protein